MTTMSLDQLKASIIDSGLKLGFNKIGFSDIALKQDADRFDTWLSKGFHGDMAYLAKNTEKRRQPELLVDGTRSVICARLNYLPANIETLQVLRTPNKAYISRYAIGRDYHKILRKKLQKLATEITPLIENFGYRVFTDSAPVLEKPLAKKAGLGWVGKHSLILDKTAGSWFFLGEIYTNIPFSSDKEVAPSCGKCKACITVCPTDAIVAPYQLDARRCISYLTIENNGPIPLEFREAIGNRIFGCDDCQLFCPWNRFAQHCSIPDFAHKTDFTAPDIADLLQWSKADFVENTLGSPLKRAGYWGWLRNVSIAAGNAPYCETLIKVLSDLKQKYCHNSSPSKNPEPHNDLGQDCLSSGQLDQDTIHAITIEPADEPPPWLTEHIDWALNRQRSGSPHPLR